eukprot:scaffold4867_cov154-Isochrysis_galbana.AAC.1
MHFVRGEQPRGLKRPALEQPGQVLVGHPALSVPIQQVEELFPRGLSHAKRRQTQQQQRVQESLTVQLAQALLVCGFEDHPRPCR